MMVTTQGFDRVSCVLHTMLLEGMVLLLSRLWWMEWWNLVLRLQNLGHDS
jgi:hypothetical protein